MPRSGSHTLAEYPKPMVRLVCKLCDRKGQYRKETLIDRFGALIPLPDLLRLIAKCERRGRVSIPCGVKYEDLIERGDG